MLNVLLPATYFPGVGESGSIRFGGAYLTVECDIYIYLSIQGASLLLLKTMHSPQLYGKPGSARCRQEPSKKVQNANELNDALENCIPRLDQENH